MAAQQDWQKHPWLQHLPRRQRAARLRQSRWRRFHQALRQPRSLMVISGVVYSGFALLLMLSRLSHLAVLVTIPALLLPALAGLAWWLTWKEFHQ